MRLIRFIALLAILSLIVAVGAAQNDLEGQLQDLLDRRAELKAEMEAANEAGDRDKYDQLLSEWETVSQQIKDIQGS